jgi:hypothetical protein
LATSYISAVISLESVLHRSSVSDIGRGTFDLLSAKSKSIEQVSEDLSAQRCISLCNPWEREGLRLETPAEILEKTGYLCGGIPSFGYQAMFLIDPKVMERKIVFTGGGSENALVKIRTEELIRANQGTILRIRK